jgi:alpha-methylacyl-CoA racemase
MAVGAIEPEFRLQLLQLLGLGEHADSIMAAPNDDIAVRAKLVQIFRSRTRAEWQQVFDGTDACVTPVLRIDEVMTHSQNRAERNFALHGGSIHPSTAPKFSRTPVPLPGNELVRDSGLKLKDWGLADAEVE